MRKFRFRLQSVLKIRKTREDEALRSLGRAQQAYQGEIAFKNQLLKELADAWKRRADYANQTIGITAYQLEDDFIAGQKVRVVRQDQAILRASRGVEKALRAYLITRRQTRMIEVIREKDYAEWKKFVAKREQRENDELTILRAAREKTLGVDGLLDDAGIGGEVA